MRYIFTILFISLVLAGPVLAEPVQDDPRRAELLKSLHENPSFNPKLWARIRARLEDPRPISSAEMETLIGIVKDQATKDLNLLRQELKKKSQKLPALAVKEPLILSLDRAYTNKYGEPMALISLTNNTGEDLFSVQVKCTWLNNNVPVAIDTRYYTNLASGQKTTERFWVKEEGLKYTQTACETVSLETVAERQNLIDTAERSHQETQERMKAWRKQQQMDSAKEKAPSIDKAKELGF